MRWSNIALFVAFFGLAAVFCFAYLRFSAPPSQAPPPPVSETAVNQLNAQTKGSLGISIPALAFLLGANPELHMQNSFLAKRGDLAYIQELENSGYALLPTSETPHGRFLRIVPTEKGERLVAAFRHGL